MKKEFQNLRKQAKQIASDRILKSKIKNPSKISDEMLKALNEVELYQIELELQNENLQKNQLELDESRKRYFDLYDQAPVGYCTISEKGAILEANLTAGRLFGVKPYTLFESLFSKYIFNDDQDIFYLHIKRLVKSGKPGSCVLRMKKDKGQLFWVQLDSVPVFTFKQQKGKDAKKTTLFRIAISDVTSNKEAEEVLAKDKSSLEELVNKKTIELIETRKILERAKRLHDIGMLAATVAHELRNPLFGINLATTIIKTHTSHNKVLNQIEVIEKMLSESDQIIDNLLFYSHIKPPTFKISDLHSILKETLDSLLFEFKSRKVIISINIDSMKNHKIRCDHIQIKEVFNNILNNAFDSVPDSGGEVEVKSRVYPREIKIYFKNNGPMIPDEILEKIFDPFFSTKQKGTGLGLTVCNQIIKMHNGSINIKSTKKQGTSFIIALPIANQ